MKHFSIETRRHFRRCSQFLFRENIPQGRWSQWWCQSSVRQPYVVARTPGWSAMVDLDPSSGTQSARWSHGFQDWFELLQQEDYENSPLERRGSRHGWSTPEDFPESPMSRELLRRPRRTWAPFCSVSSRRTPWSPCLQVRNHHHGNLKILLNR